MPFLEPILSNYLLIVEKMEKKIESSTLMPV